MARQAVPIQARAAQFVPVVPRIQRCGGVQCPPGTCDHEESQQIYRSSDGTGEPGRLPSRAPLVPRSPGQALEPSTRAVMENWFGHDFGQVRVHTDGEAAQSARAVHAQAYTLGRHIVMGPERYQPQSEPGMRLLAHELAHVVQQGNPAVDTGPARGISSPHEPSEQEAEAIADALSNTTSRTWQLPVQRTRADIARQADAGVPDYSRNAQVECVKRLGGCPNTRSGGMPSPEEITSYNDLCRRETSYSGGDVTPTSDECITPQAMPPRPRSLTVLDWGKNWNGFNVAGGILSIGEIDVTGVRDMVNKIEQTLARPPNPECISDLTIIGHGSPGSISVGAGTGYVEGSVIEGGSLDPASPAYNPAMRATLNELTPLFCPPASVTLRGCDVGDGALGVAFVQQLANLWRVPVRAPIGLVRAGGYWTSGQWTSASPQPSPSQPGPTPVP